MHTAVAEGLAPTWGCGQGAPILCCIPSSMQGNLITAQHCQAPAQPLPSVLSPSTANFGFALFLPCLLQERDRKAEDRQLLPVMVCKGSAVTKGSLKQKKREIASPAAQLAQHR